MFSVCAKRFGQQMDYNAAGMHAPHGLQASVALNAGLHADVNRPTHVMTFVLLLRS